VRRKNEKGKERERERERSKRSGFEGGKKLFSFLALFAALSPARSNLL
jgi:hypothetical protein